MRREDKSAVLKTESSLRRSWASLHGLSERLGDAFYVLDDARFESNFRAFETAFRTHYKNTWIGYSYKTNYTPYLCKMVDRLGGHAEVVSEMEYDLAERIGVDPARIIVNGPLKSEKCVSRALLVGSMVNLDSMRDLRLLAEIAGQNSARQFEIALRCNFPVRESFTSRFGFDIEGPQFREALSTINTLGNVELVGLHCHFPDRDLNSYRTRAERMLALCGRLFANCPPKYLNFGGGYFGDMPDILKRSFGVGHVSFDEYADALARPVAEAYGAATHRPKLFLEPGTALVADTMRFYARVIDVKDVRGRRFATVSGSIFNISASARRTNLPVEVIRSGDAAHDESVRKTDIVGYTCIEGDTLTQDFRGAVDVGDFVCYSNVGSYSIVMKPPFILPNVPVIRFDRDSGEPVAVRSAETVDDLFSTFVF